MVSNRPTLYIRRMDPGRIGSIHEFYSSTYVLTKSLLWLPRIGDKTADTVDHHQLNIRTVKIDKAATIPHQNQDTFLQLKIPKKMLMDLRTPGIKVIKESE